MANYAQRNTTGLLPMVSAWGAQPPAQYAPFNTVAGFTPYQQQGWGASIQGANAASGAGQQAWNQFMGMGGNANAAAQQIGLPPEVLAQMTNSQQIGQGPQVWGQQIGQGPQAWSQQIGQGPQVNAGMVNPYGPQVNAQMMGGGQTVNAQNVNAPDKVGEAGMDMFNNPYLKDSIQAGMQQNNQNFDRNVMSSLASKGVGAGNSGSSRHALAQGLAAGDLNQQNLNMASQMNERAYNQGMSNFLGQRQQNLGAQTTNAGNQLQAALANQGANLQAAGMNQGDSTQRAMANQAAGLQGQMANQGNWLQASLANQQAGLQGQMANQGNWMQGQQANQQSALAAQLANQSQWGNVQGLNQATNLQSQLANQGQWGQTQLANQAADMQSQLANQQTQLGASGQNAGNWLSSMQGNQAADLQAQLGNMNYMQSMMGAMPGMMNSFTQSQMLPGMTMENIGGQQQAMNQSQINAIKNRWDFGQNATGNKLNQLVGMFNGTGAGSFGESESKGSSGKF